MDIEVSSDALHVGQNCSYINCSKELNQNGPWTGLRRLVFP